jgi:hypothetical protein
MQCRLLLILGAVAVIIAGCSRSPATSSSAMATAPSPLTAATPGGDDVLRTAVVAFPPRPEGIDFRGQLENKYRGMGRSPAEAFVDHEGDAAWIGEYYRYRVNGCDHDTAMHYVRLQIDTGTVAPICAASFFPENAVYPAREQSVDFRRQLGKKYQSMGRSSQSAVDVDGIGIWMAEYFRYRTSGCDHATAAQNTLTQVDGNPAPETCLAQCVYRGQEVSISAAGGTFRAEPERTSGSCDWLAESEVPWINLSRPVTGGNRSPLTFTVQPNPDPPRRGSIRLSYPGGQVALTVDQSSPSHSLAFEFFDPARSSTAVTECQIQSKATICTLNPVATLPTVIVHYDWRVEYAYDGSRVRTQVGPLSTMSFTESCGILPGTNVVVPISVRVIATDASGNTATIHSGQGAQPALQLRAFACP